MLFSLILLGSNPWLCPESQLRSAEFRDKHRSPQQSNHPLNLQCHTGNPPWNAQMSGYSNGHSWVGFLRQGRAWGCPALPARLTRESEKNWNWKKFQLEKNSKKLEIGFSGKKAGLEGCAGVRVMVILISWDKPMT